MTTVISESDRLNVGIRTVNPAGLMLGVAVGDRFSKGLAPATITSQSGDVVLIYSDGVVEAMNVKDEQFGTERLEEILSQGANRGPAAVIEKLEKNLAELGKDDSTTRYRRAYESFQRQPP